MPLSPTETKIILGLAIVALIVVTLAVIYLESRRRTTAKLRKRFSSGYDYGAIRHEARSRNEAKRHPID